MIRRRDFIRLLGSAAALWPMVARGQQRALPVVGFLHSQTPDAFSRMVAGFRQGLKELGFVEGQNVVVEYRWGNNQNERLPALAAELVSRQVAVIVAAGGPATALAAKAATSTLPIVVAFGSDPVKLGLVASLNRPGGNVTGVTFITTELRGKRLDILCALVPQAVTTAYLSVPDTPTSEEGKRDMIAAARALGREIVVLEVRSHHDLEAAFGTLVQRRVGALVVGAFPMFTNNREKLLALAAHHKIPTIYPNRSYTSEGGLVSYGADLVDAFRQGGVYAGRILKGAKPADLPVQQPTRFELAINLKTAKALGLTVPDTLLVSADEVIE